MIIVDCLSTLLKCMSLNALLGCFLEFSPHFHETLLQITVDLNRTNEIKACVSLMPLARTWPIQAKRYNLIDIVDHAALIQSERQGVVISGNKEEFLTSAAIGGLSLLWPAPL